jgi:hypothetical protein
MEYVIALVVLFFAIPVGFFLREITKEELGQGRKYFKIIWIISFLLGIGFIFIKPYMGFSLLFISIVSFISWRK